MTSHCMPPEVGPGNAGSTRDARTGSARSASRRADTRAGSHCIHQRYSTAGYLPPPGSVIAVYMQSGNPEDRDRSRHGRGRGPARRSRSYCSISTRMQRRPHGPAQELAHGTKLNHVYEWLTGDDQLASIERPAGSTQPIHLVPSSVDMPLVEQTGPQIRRRFAGRGRLPRPCSALLDRY